LLIEEFMTDLPPDAATITAPLPSAEELREMARSMKKKAGLIETLAKALNDPRPGPFRSALARIKAAEDPDLNEIVQQFEAWLVEESTGRRRRLTATLRAACAEAGVELIVLGRDPLELRLPPVSACIDVDANRVRICFARLELARCEARGPDIVAARQQAVAQLEEGEWDAPGFLADLRVAWGRASQGQAAGWVELQDVLPELAFIRQSAKFRLDPTAKQFVPYPRVQLCYDLWRLRRDRCLSGDGWRLSLGSATGGSTKDKKRVYFLEDDRGRGQYHLTLRFVREVNDG
jgi:hypothetical protein